MQAKAACPTLYILMRSDMESLNAGKAMAQAAHAANQFVATAFAEGIDISDWATAGNGSFGTTLTLAVSEREMRECTVGATEEGYLAGLIHDPTYPIRDGKVTHYIPLDTCAFVFTPCRHTMRVPALAGLPLHP